MLDAEGYTLLGDYVNATTKIDALCPKGHKIKVYWIGWNIGHRCPLCNKYCNRYTYEEVKKCFESEGYTLLSKTYKTYKHKLECICPEGHHSFITFDSWKQGHRCWKCGGTCKKDYNDIKKEFEKYGYTLLSKTYKDAHSKLKFRCPNGHLGNISWMNFKQGTRCKQCYLDSKFKDWTEQQIKDFKEYKKAVRSTTNKNYKWYKHIINPNKKVRNVGKYHVDHIYSVIDGFLNNIDVEIISNPFNLQMLSAFDNISKNGRSDINIDELYYLYTYFVNTLQKRSEA